MLGGAANASVRPGLNPNSRGVRGAKAHGATPPVGGDETDGGYRSEWTISRSDILDWTESQQES
ncbi:MAG: hypothetical protein WA982_06910 [Rubrobacteraceae bacterium]